MKIAIYVCDKCGKRIEAEADTIAPLQEFGYNGYRVGSFCEPCSYELHQIRVRHERNHYEELCNAFPDADKKTKEDLFLMVKISK